MGAPAWDDLTPAQPASAAAPKWDDLSAPAQPPAAPAAPANPVNYDDGSKKFGGVLGWLQAADRLSGRSAHSLVSGVDRFGQGVAHTVGLDGVANYFGKDAQQEDAQAQAPVPGAVSWNDVKANPSVGGVLSYIGQGALGATPDLAAVTVAPWLYGASREGDIAHNRAVNNQHPNLNSLVTGQQPDVAPSWQDMLLALPAAAADTYLMKYGVGGIAGEEGMSLGKGMVNAAKRDAIMGAGQPVVDYAGSTVGTNKPFDAREALDQAAAGAVAMAPFGAAAHAAVHGFRNAGNANEPGPSPERPQAVVDQLTPDEIAALTEHGVDISNLTNADAARAAAAKLMAAKPQPDVGPIISDPRAGNIKANATTPAGLDPTNRSINAGDERNKFMSNVVGVESHGDPNAKNTRSSASGLGQFTDDTFVRQYQARFGNGESRESILAKKNDPHLQGVLLNDLTNANGDVLTRSGVPLTAGNYYLAHFAGAGGAVKAWRNPDASVEQLLGQKAVDANPFLRGMTGKDLVAWSAGKMHEGGAMLPAGHVIDYNTRPSDVGDNSVYRAPDFSHTDSTEPYGFDPAERPQTLNGKNPADTFGMGEGDNGGRRSFTQEELNQPGARGEGMATGGMGRPFKADPNTGDFENVQRDRVKQAEADVEKRWQARKEAADRMKAEFEARRARDRQQNASGRNDASSNYSKFGTEPHWNPEQGAFHTTDDGYVADKDGNPVVWPTQTAAAKWAARFKMGGDFELQAHGTSTKDGDQPVTLQRKQTSDYGQRADGAPPPRSENVDVVPPDGAPPPQGDTPQLTWDNLHDTPEEAQAAARQRQAPPADKFPGDFTPQETADARAQKVYNDNRPPEPGKEPKKAPTFFSDLASHLARESKRTGVATKIDAEDAINHGVPAEQIYHNPNDRYPTIKANAAKVFGTNKAPLNSRGKASRVVSLDHIGDSFNPHDYGVPAGDGVQGHRLAPEHAGDLLRRSMENDNTARNQAHANFDEHKAWTDRMAALSEFEDKYGEDWTKLTDEQLAELDPRAFDQFYDDVLRAAERPDVDPFDPRFWENEGEQPHQGEAGQSDVSGRSAEDHSGSARDTGQSNDGAHGLKDGTTGIEFSRDHGQRDAFGNRDGDTRRSLERKAEEPLRGKKEQKAPGSDGGLFDDHGHGDRQGSLLHADSGLREINDRYNYSAFRDIPRARIPEGVIKDGMDADRALNWVMENSKDEFHQQLANTLLDMVGGIKIGTYDRAAGLPAEYGDALRGAHGAVVHKDGQARIFLNTSKHGQGLTEETLLHEAIHAAIAIRLGNLRATPHAEVDAARGYGQDVRRIKVLQGLLADHLRMLDRTGKFKERDYAYETLKAAQIASENIDEFLTYAMTDKEFQRLLSEIDVPETHAQTTRLSAWQRFVNVARRVIGLDAKYTPQFEKLLDAQNAFHASIDTFNDMAGRLDQHAGKEQSGAEFSGKTGFEPSDNLDRRAGEDRREFGRRGEPDRRQVRASDHGMETGEDRRARQASDNEAERQRTRTARVVDGARRLLNDENGSLNVDNVAKFFVDLDTVRDMKEGVKKLAERLRTSTPREILAKSLDGSRMGGRVIASYFHSIDARMRGLAARFDSPTIRALADTFHARAGRADGTGQTYHEAVFENSRRWNRQLYNTLLPFAKDADAMERIRNIITKTGTGSKEETAAANSVSKLLKTIHDYRLDAGEDIGHVDDGYFPRVLNPDVVAKNGDEFKQLAESLFIKAGETPTDAQAKAESWFHQVVNENAGLDGAILNTRRAKAPGTTSGLPRSLGKEADTVLAKFYQKDPLDVLQSYITGSVKRAEFTRRFGVPGREGSRERTDWQAQHGHKDQLDVIRKKINEEILASGKEPGDAQQQINDILEANLGILGKSSSSFRLAVSLSHAYNQIAKMDHSLITSLNELAMGFVRHGPVGGIKFLANTVKEFGRELLKMEPSEARRYAEHLGMVLNPLMDQVLQSRISAVEGTKGINKVVGKFYRTIGLHQFTEGERVAASKMAREAINALAGDLDSNNARTVRRAERALAELGITDHQAFKQWLNQRSGKPTFGEIDANTGMAAKWATAVNRMTNQTVMEPTRAVKPLWANHPLGSLLYGLMSYTFAFKKNVMDRAFAMAGRAVTERDPHLLMPLLFGLPILGAFTYMNDTYLRPALFGSSYDFKDETAPMAVLRAADRASMDGALSPVVNVMFGTKYQRSLSEAFIGSFAGSVLQGVESMAVKPIQAKVNGTEGNAAQRGAAAALYDILIEPAIDAAAVAGIGGKVATGVVYASGSRPGSIFPQDRAAFIDAMAGQLEESHGSGGHSAFGGGHKAFGEGHKAFGGGRKAF